MSELLELQHARGILYLLTSVRLKSDLLVDMDRARRIWRTHRTLSQSQFRTRMIPCMVAHSRVFRCLQDVAAVVAHSFFVATFDAQRKRPPPQGSLRKIVGQVQNSCPTTCSIERTHHISPRQVYDDLAMRYTAPGGSACLLIARRAGGFTVLENSNLLGVFTRRTPSVCRCTRHAQQSCKACFINFH